MLIFTASEVETAGLGMGVSPAAAGLLGGMAGGVAQAYATMGEYFFHVICGTFFTRDAYDYVELVLRTMMPQINHLSGLICPRFRLIDQYICSNQCHIYRFHYMYENG